MHDRLNSSQPYPSGMYLPQICIAGRTGKSRFRMFQNDLKLHLTREWQRPGPRQNDEKDCLAACGFAIHGAGNRLKSVKCNYSVGGCTSDSGEASKNGVGVARSQATDDFLIEGVVQQQRHLDRLKNESSMFRSLLTSATTLSLPCINQKSPNLR